MRKRALVDSEVRRPVRADDERDGDEEWRPNFRLAVFLILVLPPRLTYRLEGTAERDADFLFQMLPKDGRKRNCCTHGETATGSERW